ncbi:hypothetical protein [Kribbella sp. NBC_00889]|nr:hypothetical protein OG817_36565 [Kribbella sp. NBC_00889]
MAKVWRTVARPLVGRMAVPTAARMVVPEALKDQRTAVRRLA